MSSSAARTSAAIAAGKAKSKAAAAATSSTSSSAAPSAKRVSRANSTEKPALDSDSTPASKKTPSMATKARKETATAKRKVIPQSNVVDQAAQNTANNAWPALRSNDVIGDLNSLAQLRFHSTPTPTAAQSADASSSYFIATPSPLLHAWATRCSTLERASEPLRQQAGMISNLQQDMQQFLQMANNYLKHAQHGASSSSDSSSINLQ